jgi:hypothetical protein
MRAHLGTLRLALAVPALLASCRSPLPDARFGCVRDDDCPPEMRCGGDSLCRRALPATDAATPRDALPSDAPMSIDGAMTSDARSPLDDAARDAGLPDCGPPASREVTTVSGTITASTTWTCDTIWLLEGTVQVDDELTIEPGTRIEAGPLGVLVVGPEGRLLAEGTAAQPIVFASSGDTAAGAWGGVALLGRAPTNDPSRAVPGIPGEYGGSVVAHDCGRLRYVRIEGAGASSEGFALSGLELAGCGDATRVSYVQVEHAADRAFSIRGGSVPLDHVIATRSSGAGIRWENGWVGTAEFVVVEARGTAAGLEGNSGLDHDATPRSHPRIYHATLLGGGDPAIAVIVRRGSYLELSHTIVADWATAVIDARDAATYGGIASESVWIRDSIFFGVGPDGMTTTTGVDDNDAAVVSSPTNRIVDPGLMSRVPPIDLEPTSGSAATAAPAPPPPFDIGATFVGAVGPGDDWTAGWSTLP